MQLKIISNGTRAGTFLVDERTGEPVANVASMAWSVGDSGVEATVLLSGLPAEVVIDTADLEPPAPAPAAEEAPQGAAEESPMEAEEPADDDTPLAVEPDPTPAQHEPAWDLPGRLGRPWGG